MQKDVDPIIELARAYHFAATYHTEQRRNGAAAAPYMNHLTEVAELVAEASGGDVSVVIAAVLHDTVEDTTATSADVEAMFGADVAGLVAEVTDDKSLLKHVRKQLQIEHAAHASRRAQLIKMADKISNLRSLAISPPADWDAERLAEYCSWSARVVEGCRAAHHGLAQTFDEAHHRAVGSF